MSRFKRFVRIAWPSAGVLFFIWLLISTQSRGFSPSVLQSDASVSVAETDIAIHFVPLTNQSSSGLIFYPGAMIDPKAYAPIARQLAEAGFQVAIVKLPFRMALTGTQEEFVWDTTIDILEAGDSVYWAVGGHSRGAAIASRFAFYHPDRIDALILIGTTHPKVDTFDLSNLDLKVTKIYGTNDGLATVAEIRKTSQFLPDDTIFIEINGGNHAQFGYYGPQLGDNAAEISRTEQQEITVNALKSILDSLDAELDATSQ